MKVMLRCSLKEILIQRKISQKELAAMTGLRDATISELCNNVRISYNRNHLEKIMNTLGITEVSDIIQTIHIEERSERK